MIPVPSSIGRFLEVVLVRLESQPPFVHVTTGVLLAAGVIAGGLATFYLTLEVLVEYLR